MNTSSHRSLTICTFVLALVWLSCQAVAGSRTTEKVIIYSNPERTAQDTVRTTTWTKGAIPSRAPIGAEAKYPLLSESLEVRIVDCSDGKYRCLRSWGHVFAVPRNGVKPGEKYKKDGWSFVVAKCLRGSRQKCQVALIGVGCFAEYDMRTGLCGGTHPERSSTKGSTVGNFYFLFNEEFGITAYGGTDKVVVTNQERLCIASQMILQSKEGILGPGG